MYAKGMFCKVWVGQTRTMFTQIIVVCKDDEREEQMGSRSGDRFKQCIEVMNRQERNEMSKRNSKTSPQIYQPKTNPPKRMAL